MSTYRNSYRRRIDDTMLIWRDEMRQVLKDEGVLIFFIIVPLIYPLLYSWIYRV